MGFPSASVVKNPPASVGDMDSIPGSGRFPGERNGNQFQYSCLEIPLIEESGESGETVYGVAKKSDTT